MQYGRIAARIVRHKKNGEGKKMDWIVIPQYASSFPALLLLSFAFNLIVCRDIVLVRTFKTPLAMASRSIDALETRYNRPELTPRMRRSDGISTAVVFIIVTLIVGISVDLLAQHIPYLWILEAFALGTLFSARSFLDQSMVLADGLDRSVEEGRAMLALISGRDTEDMDAPAVARAAVETTARTLSAGIITPAFYLLMFGAAGLLLFKTINIAADMIDEKSELSADFGWAIARVNDLLMWPGSLLTAMILAFASLLSPGRRFVATLREATRSAHHYHHKGAGSAVAGIAGALNLKLGGPISYEGREINGGWVGTGSVFADSSDIRTARSMFIKTSAIFMLFVVGLMWLKLSLLADILF